MVDDLLPIVIIIIEILFSFVFLVAFYYGCQLTNEVQESEMIHDKLLMGIELSSSWFIKKVFNVLNTYEFYLL